MLIHIGSRSRKQAERDEIYAWLCDLACPRDDHVHTHTRMSGEYVVGQAVFATERESYRYILEIAARDLQYRGYRDDRVANSRYEISSQSLVASS